MIRTLSFGSLESIDKQFSTFYDLSFDKELLERFSYHN